MDKNLTGIAAEYATAAELSRRGFNVSMTFGKTKAIDLLVEKDGKLTAIQVKGIWNNASQAWNMSIDKIQANIAEQKYNNVMYVCVNLHADTLIAPEFFIMTPEEICEYAKPTGNGRDYMRCKVVREAEVFKDAWHKIGVN
jgi:hypothetical protein